MAESRIVVRSVVWRELFPWLLIFRSFRVATSIPVLLLASLGTLLTPIGWNLANQLFGPAATPRPVIMALPAVDFPLLDLRQLPDMHFGQFLDHSLRTSVLGVYGVFVQPFAELVSDKLTFSQFARGAFVGIWTVLVWGVFGGAITRIAVVQLGREERVGLVEALRFSLRHVGWNFAAPIFPLAGVFICTLPIALLGFAMRLDFGVAIVGLIWLLVLLGGAAILILVLGLAFGWPLMWPAISAEESGDAFEAFSRSYAFTLNRPLNYLFYVVLVIVYGLLCWLLVWALASGTINAAYWAASWGAGHVRIEDVIAPPENRSFLLGSGAALIHLAVLVVRVIATGFNYAFFFAAASAVYLCLRRDVDRTEFDEVFMDGETTRYQLPPLGTDTAGGNETTASSLKVAGVETPANENGPPVS